MIKRYKLQVTSYTNSGFTIIELLVAIAIFSVVVSVAVGGFVRALRTQRQVVALMAANSNVSLAIEQMAREIRTGRNFTVNNPFLFTDCGSDPSRGSELTFTNGLLDQITYRFFSMAEEGFIDREVNGASDHITGKNVRIRYVCFGLLGDQPYPGDEYPPRVTVSIGISPVAQGVSDNITNIQTTISARQIDS